MNTSTYTITEFQPSSTIVLYNPAYHEQEVNSLKEKLIDILNAFASWNDELSHRLSHWGWRLIKGKISQDSVLAIQQELSDQEKLNLAIQELRSRILINPLYTHLPLLQPVLDRKQVWDRATLEDYMNTFIRWLGSMHTISSEDIESIIASVKNLMAKNHAELEQDKRETDLDEFLKWVVSPFDNQPIDIKGIQPHSFAEDVLRWSQSAIELLHLSNLPLNSVNQQMTSFPRTFNALAISVNELSNWRDEHKLAVYKQCALQAIIQRQEREKRLCNQLQTKRIKQFTKNLMVKVEQENKKHIEQRANDTKKIQDRLSAIDTQAQKNKMDYDARVKQCENTIAYNQKQINQLNQDCKTKGQTIDWLLAENARQAEQIESLSSKDKSLLRIGGKRIF